MHHPPAVQVTHHETLINGVRIHHVRTGRGAPVILIPGWPQSWFAWRHLLSPFASAGRTVYVVEPRGMGDSGQSDDGYDIDSVVADLHTFAAQFEGGALCDVVAHDIGAWIAHGWAVTFGGDIRSLCLVDAAIPGVTPTHVGVPDESTNIRTWHFAFNRLDGLPELLIGGREREFLSWLFASKSYDSDVFDDVALDEYTRVLAVPGAIRAGMDYYRAAFSVDGLARATARAKQRLTMPVLAVGADNGVRDMLYNSLFAMGDRVHGVTINSCGHYVPEERPAALVEATVQFWATLD